MNAAGLDVRVEDVSEALAALALQGPFSRAVLEAATGESFADLRYFRRRASQIGGVDIDVSRTGYTGDLGYELWIPAESAPDVWDALFEAGRAYAIRPAGMLALDVVRLEAGPDHARGGLHVRPPRDEPGAELQPVRDRPRQARVSFDKGDYVGRRALARRAAGGRPGRRLVGLQLDWYDIEGLFDAQGLPPAISPYVDRSPVPVFADGRQVGRATSHGWSPILKQALALAVVPPRYERLGTPLQVEWTVEGRRGRVERDGRRAAVPRPRAQARMTTGDGAPGDAAPGTDFSGLRPAGRRAPRGLGGGAAGVPADPIRGRRRGPPARGRRVDGRAAAAGPAPPSTWWSSRAPRRSSWARSAMARER